MKGLCAAWQSGSDEGEKEEEGGESAYPLECRWKLHSRGGVEEEQAGRQAGRDGEDQWFFRLRLSMAMAASAGKKRMRKRKEESNSIRPKMSAFLCLCFCLSLSLSLFLSLFFLCLCLCLSFC